MVGASSQFAADFNEFMYYAGPILQLMYWIIIAVAAVFAAWQFKRYVDHVVGGKSARSARGVEDAAASESGQVASDKTEIDIDKFVE